MKSNRDWIEQAINHRESESVPYNFMFSPPASRIVMEQYGKDIEESLAMPIRMNAPGSPKPLFADPDKYGDRIADEFGVVWSTNKIDRGSPIEPCLKEDSLSGYTFPDPTRKDRFDGLPEWCRKQAANYRVLWVGDLWERATFMRGMEPLLLDVALNPAFVDALLERLTELILETTRILIQTCEFESIAVSDDYASQSGLLMSPDHWRTLIKPKLARIYALAKQHDLTVFHHSCGNVTAIIGDMIDIGLDILHPIQPEAMDIVCLKKEFGQRLTFCGGVPTQTLLVSGTPTEVRREVKRLKRVMGKGGGYILEPGITIQADVPRDNIIALIDEARTPGR